MTRKIQKPEAYKMVAKSREDIVAAIIDITDQRTYHHDPYYLCFNVKLYGLDLSLENMLKKWREYEGDQPYTHNPVWLENVKERFEEHEGNLWEWGVEDARRSFDDTDCFNHLWDGTSLDVEYGFVGRSGGWLAIVKFEGYQFDRRMDSDLEDTLKEMDFGTLKKLYQLVLMLKHDTREEARTAEVEHQAAFCFFANICNDIPQTDEELKKVASHTVRDNHEPTPKEMQIRTAIHTLQDVCGDNVVLMQENGVYLIPSILGEDKINEDAEYEDGEQPPIEAYAGTVEYQVSDGLPGHRSTSFDFYHFHEALVCYNEIVQNGWTKNKGTINDSMPNPT